MARLKSYDAKQVTVAFNNKILTGYAENDFCQVEMNSETWTHHIGASGEECRARSNDDSGKIIIKLAQYSTDNAVLASLWLADKSVGGGVGAIMVADKSGASLHASDEAYIIKAPAAGYGTKPGDREWTFQCSNLKHYVAGN